MAMQVVTSENLQQFVQTGSVPEFKPPEAKAAEPATAKPASGESKQPEEQKPGETARDAAGRFTKQEPADKNPSAAPKADDDEGGDDLPEHARKVIGKKHRQMKEAEEFAREQWRAKQAAEERAEKLQRQLEEQNAKSRPAAAKAEKPKPEDFATVAEYTDALVEYRVAEKLQAEREKSEREAAEQAAAERARQFGERIAKAKEKHADFEEVVSSITGTEIDRVHKDVVEYLQESEFGADLLYHLAKNPKDLDRFRKLSPRRFIAELGKLEAKLESVPDPPTTTTLSQAAATATAQPAVSKAPAPIAALSSDKSTVVNKDPATMSFKELREYERARDAERRARR